MISKILRYGMITSGIAGVLLAAIGFGPSVLHGQEKKSPAYAAASVSASAVGDPNVFVNLSRKIVPSVVNISTLSTVKSPFGPGGADDLFRRFFEDFFRRHGGPMPRGEQPGDDEEEAGPPLGSPRGAPKSMALGTGFIIDSSGLILTNNHVVAGADEIKIFFTESADEKPTDAEVVGRDPEIDVALIKVKTKRELAPVVFGDSDKLEVGEYVMAVGNPFGQGHSVTHGIISAKGRLAPDFPLASYIQTDAPINPGNSGGPLVNLKGEVIGINNAIEARAQGIGFAIPINVVKKVLDQLKTKGTVARGYIGVLVNELSPEVASKIGVSKDLEAPFVTHVYPGEPADRAGIKPYDVILEFGSKKIHSGSDLIASVTSIDVGDSVPVKIRRGSEEKILKVKIGQRPGTSTLAEQEEQTRKKPKKPAPVETGMKIESLPPEAPKGGVLVTTVSPGGPADQAGLMRGDVILEADRKSVKDPDSFYSIVKEKKSYLLRVRRQDQQGRELFAVVVLDLKD
jgi:serine protease Do